MKKILPFIIFCGIILNSKSQTNWTNKTYGSLKYSYPKEWTEIKYSVTDGNKSYGSQYFASGKTAKFSVIEAANNINETNAHNLSSEDIQTIVLGIFSPNSTFTKVENRKLSMQNAKYAKASAITSTGMSVSSVNYVVFYKNKTLLIQGIYPSKDESEFLPIFEKIIGTIKTI